MAKRRYKLSDEERKEYISLRRRLNYRHKKIVEDIMGYKPPAAKDLAIEFSPPKASKRINSFTSKAQFEAYKASLKPWTVQSWEKIKNTRAADYKGAMIAAAAAAFGDQLQIDVILASIGQMSNEQIIKFANKYDQGKIATWYKDEDKAKSFSTFQKDLITFWEEEKGT